MARSPTSFNPYQYRVADFLGASLRPSGRSHDRDPNSYLGRLSLRRENTPPRHAVECVNVNVSTPVTQSDRARQCVAAHRPVDHLGKLGPTLRRHIGTIRFAAAAAE